MQSRDAFIALEHVGYTVLLHPTVKYTDPVSLPPILRFEAPPGPAGMMRLFTIILAVTMVILGALAAHHAQGTQGETNHAVIAELDTNLPPLAASGGSPDSAGEHLMLGLATGCIVLIACFTLGLALLATRAWRAQLFRRLNAVVHALYALIIDAPPTALATVARPSLVALSISRT